MTTEQELITKLQLKIFQLECDKSTLENQLLVAAAEDTIQLVNQNTRLVHLVKRLRNRFTAVEWDEIQAETERYD